MCMKKKIPVNLGSRLIIIIIIIIISSQSAGTHSSALDFLNAVGGRLAAASGEPRETSFLWQRISVLIQRFNAILIAKLFFIRTKHQTSSHS